jgi:hypothetical protein
MTDIDSVRPSRDGDQFHYQWAARQSLRLLRPGTDLTAIVVEGVSPDDTASRAGEQVVDLAEYYGSTELRKADRVIYRQLKHSTQRSTEEWSVSGLKKTVEGFAKKFRDVIVEMPGVERNLSFEFVTNRPVRASIVRAIDTLALSDTSGMDTHDVRFLREYAGFASDSAAESMFFRAFRIDPSAPSLFELVHLVRSDVAGLLPGTAEVEHVLLKEMIALRATSLKQDPVVRRVTVLTALRATEDVLLPAPNLIHTPEQPIMTDQIKSIASAIVSSSKQPVVVHAAGGVGKSVLTTQIGHHLPAGSHILVYDCFGNGEYRRSSSPRHHHRHGLVQMSNELAARALCDPLIPVPTAHPEDYSRAFLVRLRIAADVLAAKNPGALLAIVVDAADNAALFARDRDERTFVTDLLREQLPEGVRLVMLSRTERVDLLDPPPHALRIKLAGFSVQDSTCHLRTVFSQATEAQAKEFHRRTGGNPRVQAFVLQDTTDIRRCLASLGVARHVDGVSLDDLLRRRVAEFRDHDRSTADSVDRLCQALAALRPRIPVRVLSELCSVPADLIHSFVADLGRPLLIDGDTLQFRDEPTETWFRTHHRPVSTALTDFIERLIPLADHDAYVATSLPELLWEAGRVDELVTLAMTDAALPRRNDLEQAEIAQQRIQFALKATLRVGRDFEAARLALKAGALTAGRSRTLRLIRHNTDLAGRFLDAQTIEDLIATRDLAGSWPGSHLHHEGALLSAASGQIDLARSRLRSAIEWTDDWIHQPGRREHGVTAHDIAEIAFGLLNTDGAQKCVRYLSRWTPRTVVFDASLIIATRLADTGRTQELEHLVEAASTAKPVQYAVACAAWQAAIVCSTPVARTLLTTLEQQQQPLDFTRPGQWPRVNLEIRAVTWIVAMCLRQGVLTTTTAESILLKCLPEHLPRNAGSDYTSPVDDLLCGFALLARTRQQTFEVDRFAHPDITKERQQRNHAYSHARVDYERNIKPLAGWAQLWIDVLLDGEPSAVARFDDLADHTLKNYSDHETPFALLKGVTRLGARILASRRTAEPSSRFLEWCTSHQHFIGFTALTDAVRTTAASEPTHTLALALAQLVSTALHTEPLDAEHKTDEMVALARATYQFSPEEARAHFADAIAFTDRVGDDVHTRSETMLSLARVTGNPAQPDDRRAYRVAQVIEAFAAYRGEATDHSDELVAIAHLSPTTALAVASRWRDRCLSELSAFVRAVTEQATSPLVIDPVSALATLPLSDHSNTLELLTRALQTRPHNGRRLVEVIGTFARHHKFHPESLNRLDHITTQFGIDLTGTPLAADTRHVATKYHHHINTSRDWLAEAAEDPQRSEREQQARENLAIHDLTTAQGWENARRSVRADDAPLSVDDLIKHALLMPANRLHDMLASFLTNPHWSIYDYQTMINQLAMLPTLSRATRAQMAVLAKTMTMRHCRSLTTTQYQLVDLTALGALADTDDLLGAALMHLGTLPITLKSVEYFALAARLAERLTSDKAGVVLDDMTTLHIDIAPNDFGDGTYEELAPAPATAAIGLAGYLWVALGAPDSESRWRAAHSVRLLADLGCTDELQALQHFALGTLSAAPFTDTRLHFYDKHALQWLLFALARAALDTTNHPALCYFLPLLRRVVFDDPLHVIMQVSAKSTLDALLATGHAQLTPTEQDNCQLATSYGYIEHRNTRPDPVLAIPATQAIETPESTRRSLFLDFPAYWCAPLGEVFDLSEVDIDQRVAHLLQQTGFAPAGWRDIDLRHKLNLHRGTTNPYKLDWPQSEDLRFYTAVHALWTVAADLFKTHPVRPCPNTSDDPFTRWIHRFLLTRPDGRWLADRRDAPPNSVFATHAAAPTAEWVWSLNQADFTEQLFADDEWITVRAYTDDGTYDASQEVRIDSALVNPDKARALLVALQTAPSFRWRLLPEADDEDSAVATEGFHLAGWIAEPYLATATDGRDPFAARVRYPPPHPGAAAVRLLGLTSDADMRIWRQDGCPALRSSAWHDIREMGRDSGVGQQGYHLQIHRDTLIQLLQKTRRSLIVEVTIERTHKQIPKTYGAESDDDEPAFLEPSRTVYLFDESGRCQRL